MTTRPPRSRRVYSFLLASLLSVPAAAHDGHDHAPTEAPTPAPTAARQAPAEQAVTGSGDLRFRYRADLSALPEEIATGLHRAHGGFAKGPAGEVYFGLNGVGVVRVSADLRDKTVLAGDEPMRGGGLHNTTFVDRDGGLLILPDNERAKVHVLRTDGSRIGELGRPAVDAYYENAENPYRPTDACLGPDGRLYVCDGYSPSKLVLTADLATLAYGAHRFGGPVDGPGRQEGRFSTNHGITLDPADDTLLVSDRERQWVQRLTPAGEFVAGYDTLGGDVCDVDFVDYRGERLMIAGCLKSGGGEPGFVQILRDGEVVSTLKPKADLGLELFQHVHNAAGIVVDGKLYVLCYGWNPGCYAVLERVSSP